MATQAEIQADINLIVTNGNYTANKLRPLLTSILSYSANTVTITRAALQSLISGSTVNPQSIYKITDGVSDTKVIFVFGLTTSSITDNALNITDGTFGSYDITTDVYTSQGGGGTPTMQDTYAAGNVIDNYDFLINSVTRSITITRDSTFSGDDLIAFGNRALNNNEGEYITGIGSSAAEENTGDKVIAIGQSAAYENTGNNINAIGYLAALSNTASSVIAIGESAGRKNSAAFCTFIGINAGYNTGGDVGNSLASQFVIANNNMPSYADRAAATTAITVLLGAVAGNTYLYYNQTTFAIEAVRL